MIYHEGQESLSPSRKIPINIIYYFYMVSKYIFRNLDSDELLIILDDII